MDQGGYLLELFGSDLVAHRLSPAWDRGSILPTALDVHPGLFTEAAGSPADPLGEPVAQGRVATGDIIALDASVSLMRCMCCRSWRRMAGGVRRASRQLRPWVGVPRWRCNASLARVGDALEPAAHAVDNEPCGGRAGDMGHDQEEPSTSSRRQTTSLT